MEWKNDKKGEEKKQGEERRTGHTHTQGYIKDQEEMKKWDYEAVLLSGKKYAVNLTLISSDQNKHGVLQTNTQTREE